MRERFILKPREQHYLFVFQDDPMSALDVHVGSHIFQRAIVDYLLQQKKTVLLVTHHLQYMALADQVQLSVQSGHGQVCHTCNTCVAFLGVVHV